MNSIREELLDYLSRLDIVDAHEHLVPERMRIEADVDVLTLVGVYSFVDMLSAGFPTEGRRSEITNHHAMDTSISLEQRWKDIAPYLERIQYGTYFRPTRIALRDLYGIDHLDESTIFTATERIRAENRKGLYYRILREKCRIRTCLVQNGYVEDQDPMYLLTPVYFNTPCFELNHPDFFRYLEGAYGQSLDDLPTYLDALRKELARVRQLGAVGFKIGAYAYPPPDREQAAKDYRAFLEGQAPTRLLVSTVLDAILEKAREWDWPVAVHSGVWEDFRDRDPKNMIDLARRYPDVRFDLYHLGMPFVRDCLFVAKNFRNVHLNLCWTYVVSQEMTRRTIPEIVDLVPVNKVHGFGADYNYDVENVYGHLVMARESLVDAFGEMVEKGRLDMQEAKRILSAWMMENPWTFYRLEEREHGFVEA